MLFKDKYPQPVPSELRVQPDIHVESRITLSGGAYECAVCRTKTGFRIRLNEQFPAVPCCSEECKARELAECPDVGPVDEPAPMVVACGHGQVDSVPERALALDAAVPQPDQRDDVLLRGAEVGHAAADDPGVDHHPDGGAAG